MKLHAPQAEPAADDACLSTASESISCTAPASRGGGTSARSVDATSAAAAEEVRKIATIAEAGGMALRATAERNKADNDMRAPLVDAGAREGPGGEVIPTSDVVTFVEKRSQALTTEFAWEAGERAITMAGDLERLRKTAMRGKEGGKGEAEG